MVLWSWFKKHTWNQWFSDYEILKNPKSAVSDSKIFLKIYTNDYKQNKTPTQHCNLTYNDGNYLLT
jgi:hypothetical protein